MNIFSLLSKASTIPTADEALPGRAEPVATSERHAVNGAPLKGPYREGCERVVFAMGCFWGAERMFWQLPGVEITAAGYIGGSTPNPTYREVCSGGTGHTEGVLVVYDPAVVSFQALLKTFWEGHDPTQGMRQGNDVGTQYRSAVFTTTPQQKALAEQSKRDFEAALKARGFAPITTEIRDEAPFYFAEDGHQQYLHKNPGGYCGLGGTGVSCPIGTGVGAPVA